MHSFAVSSCQRSAVQWVLSGTFATIKVEAPSRTQTAGLIYARSAPLRPAEGTFSMSRRCRSFLSTRSDLLVSKGGSVISHSYAETLAGFEIFIDSPDRSPSHRALERSLPITHFTSEIYLTVSFSSLSISRSFDTPPARRSLS